VEQKEESAVGKILQDLGQVINEGVADDEGAKGEIENELKAVDCSKACSGGIDPWKGFPDVSRLIGSRKVNVAMWPSTDTFAVNTNDSGRGVDTGVGMVIAPHVDEFLVAPRSMPACGQIALVTDSVYQLGFVFGLPRHVHESLSSPGTE